MIITRTPFRISFFGGGTDYRVWIREHGGAVVSTTIDKYCYITCRDLPPFFEHKHRLVYSLVENVREVRDLQHPAARAVLSELGVETGLEIHHDGDLPARSGLGSSSAFTVGLLHALHGLRGRMASKRALAEEAIRIEQDVLAENVGAQDQVAVSFGGLNRIDFQPEGSFTVQPLVCPPGRVAELESRLMLFFTGVSRVASEIAAEQVGNVPLHQSELMRMRAQVDEAISLLVDPDAELDAFGELLREGWQLKKSLSNRVSTLGIDAVYTRAIMAGALGGKILGAGGGGFILFYVPPNRRAAVSRALSTLVHVPFRFEREGSQLIFCQPAEAEFGEQTRC